MGVTDEAGVLHLAIPPRDIDGYLSVWVEAPGGIVCVAEGLLYEDDGWDREGQTFPTPYRDRCFRILVLDQDERVVPGVVGRLCKSNEGAPLPFLPLLHGNADGYIEAGPFETGNYWADISAPGKAPIRVCPYQFSEEAGDESFWGPVVLPPGKVVRGRISAQGGPPPAGSWIRCGYESTKHNETCEWYVPLGADGSFEATVRTDAPWTLTAGAPGYTTWSRDFRGESEVRVELVPVPARLP